MKQVIERKLPLSDKYHLISIQRSDAESGDAFVCDNCSQQIVNIALIQNQVGKKFHVGLDCVRTLTSALVNSVAARHEINDYNHAIRFLKFAAKAQQIDTSHPNFVFAISRDVKRAKVSRKSEWRRTLERFNLMEAFNAIYKNRTVEATA